MSVIGTTQQPVLCDSRLGESLVSVRDGMAWTTGASTSNMSSNPTPKWQAAAKSAYLEAYQAELPPATYWNQSGRAVPDVVANGHSALVVIGGRLLPIDGTSVSAPTVAGLVALLNDARLNAERPPVGFLNPLLYALHQTQPGAFNDVVVGSTNDGVFEQRGSPYPSTCEHGFAARPGYSIATGLGSPNFAAWLDGVLAPFRE